MIKGYLFTKHPFMITKGFKDPIKILEQLNPLCEKGEPVEQDINNGKNKCQVREYIAEDLFIKAFITNNKDNYLNIYEIYSIIERAAPDLITVFKYTPETLIVAIPSTSNFNENTSYSLLIDELTRLTTYLLMEFDSDEDRVVNSIQEYLSMFVSTPMTRMITDLKNKNNSDNNNDNDE